MNYEIIQNNNNVDLFIEGALFCSMIHVDKKTDTECVAGSLEIILNAKDEIYLDLINNKFDILSISFPNIKQLNNQSFYQELNGKLIAIDCGSATLVSNKNLVVSVSGSSQIVFRELQSTFTTQSISTLTTSPDLIFEKRPPSFSITFFQNFDGQNFYNLFDSYKSQQILTSSQSVNAGNNTPVQVFVKIICNTADSDSLNTQSDIVNFIQTNGPLFSSTHYSLAVYSVQSNIKQSIKIYKIQNTDQGSVYLATFILITSDFNTIFDGTRQFFVNVNKFIYKNTLNVKSSLSGGSQVPLPSLIGSGQSSITAFTQSQCCFVYLSHNLSSPVPYYTANWPSSTWSKDTLGYLYDFDIPDNIQATFVSSVFSNGNNLPLSNCKTYIGCNAKYDLINSSYLNYTWVSLLFVANEDFSIPNINLTQYTVTFFYYYADNSQPDQFTVCMGSAKIITFNAGLNYGIQLYYNFINNVRTTVNAFGNIIKRTDLIRFEVHISKSTSIFPNELRIYDFKLYSMTNCQPPNVITTQSLNPSTGVAITASQNDFFGVSSGLTQFNFNYLFQNYVTFNAPVLSPTNTNFVFWQLDGINQTPGNTALSINILAPHVITAVYTSPSPSSPSPSSPSPSSPSPSSPSPSSPSPSSPSPSSPSPASPSVPSPVPTNPTPTVPPPIPPTPTSPPGIAPNTPLSPFALSLETPACVVPGTKILTEHGEINVELLSVGDWVIGINSSNETEKYQVVNINKSSGEPIYVITHESGVLECSESHCFYCENSIKNAFALQISDTLISVSGVTKILSIEIQRPKLVIGPNLSNNGCYFANGVLVHSQSNEQNVKVFSQNSIKSFRPIESKIPRIYKSDGKVKNINVDYGIITDMIDSKFNLLLSLWKYSSQKQWKKAFYLDDLNLTEETTGYSFNSKDNICVKLEISLLRETNNYIVVKGVGSNFEMQCTFNGMPILLSTVFEFSSGNSQLFFIDLHQIESSLDRVEFEFEFKSSENSMLTNLNIMSRKSFESIMNYFQENASEK